MILNKEFQKDAEEAFDFWRNSVLSNPNATPAEVGAVQNMTFSRWVMEILRPQVYELLGRKRTNVGLDGAEGQSAG